MESQPSQLLIDDFRLLIEGQTDSYSIFNPQSTIINQ
jgi:hypothetical protein